MKKAISKDIYILCLMLIPISFFFSFTYFTIEQNGDYYFHFSELSNKTNYPKMAWNLHKLLYPQIGKELSMLVLGLTIFIVTPTFLLYLITKKLLASFTYLYITGIPFFLFNSWVLAQGLINIFILIAALNPIYIWILLLFGPYIHREWFLASILIIMHNILFSRWYKDAYSLLRKI